MFSVDDFIVYKRDVCKVVGFSSFRGNDYYVLCPILDDSLKINVPVSNGDIRGLISLDGIHDLIRRIPSIPVVSIDSKNVDAVYKSLFDDGSYESLISIIKTAYTINNDRVLHNKKIRDKDDFYFKRAEELLYSEFSIVLNMSIPDTRKYVISCVEGLV